MTIKLNHTIVHSRDKQGAARFFAEFDQIFGRIQERGLAYWADPGRSQKGEINRHFGGRGVYFDDPSGHLLEIITKPYGDW
jgi:catechol 2,3-dioxygenase-like lactoylglutathione lyase family enzyme